MPTAGRTRLMGGSGSGSEEALPRTDGSMPLVALLFGIALVIAGCDTTSEPTSELPT